MEENEKKLKELILYIADRCAEDTTFGAVKLNKILYLSDFIAYGEFGKPITGVEYMKLPNGPAPKRLLPIREELVKAGELHIREISYFGRTQHRIIPLRKPRLDVFTQKEISLVDHVINALCGVSASDVSTYTHKHAGWRVAEDKGTIPYESVFLSDDPMTDDDIERGRELAARYGW